MNGPKSILPWGLGLAALFLGGWSWQHQRTLALQREIMAERAGARDLTELRRQRERLVVEPVSELRLSQLRADHEAVARLRGEVDGLKKRNEEMERSQAKDVEGMAADAKSAVLTVPERNWKNVGRATPAAALETALWAGVGGDLEVLAATLSLDGAAKEKAGTLFASLPETERARFGSPEKLIAALSLKDLPGALTVGPATVGEDNAKVRLYTQRGTPSYFVFKETEITLRRSTDGWRLVVPDGAVESYASALKGTGSKIP